MSLRELVHGTRALIGPTASGKSALALRVAERCGAEIVSLDSMQVYRRMDVGTAKPTAAERARVRHHMLDLAEPSELFDVSRFLAELEPVLRDARERAQRLLLVGGTGFYLKVLFDGLFEGPPVDRGLRARIEARADVEGLSALHAELAALDPISAARIHANDRKRVVRALEVHAQTGRTLSDWQREWASFGNASRATQRFLVGLALPTAELDARIRVRTRAMLEAGWAEEAVAIERTCGFSKSAIQALGYVEALALARGELSFDDACARIALATRQFARRQRTWYRKFEDAVWLDVGARARDASSPSIGDGARANDRADVTDELVVDCVRALSWS